MLLHNKINNPEFYRSPLLNRRLLKKLMHSVNSKNKETAGNSSFFTSSSIYNLAQTRLLLITTGKKREKKFGLGFSSIGFLPLSHRGSIIQVSPSFLEVHLVPFSLYQSRLYRSVEFSAGRERCL